MKSDFNLNESIITVILFWCSLVVVSSLYLTIPLVPVISRTYEVTLSQAAWTSSAFSLSFAIGGLIFGILSDRYGRKHLMITGLILLIVVTPLIGSASSFSSFVILQAVEGLAASMFPPSVLALGMEIFPSNKRGTIIGFISTAFLMAAIVGQLFSSFVILKLDWSYTYYILFVIYLISAILIAYFIPRDGNQKPEGTLFSTFFKVGAILKQNSLPICYIVSSVIFISLVGYYTTLESYLRGPDFGLNHWEILLIRAVGIIGMFISPFAGRLVAKFGFKNILWTGLTLSGIGLGIQGFTSDLYLLLIMSVLFVTGISLTLPTIISLIGQLAGHSRGTAVSFHMFMAFTGASIGPIVSIELVKIGGHLITFASLAGILFLSLIIPFFIRIEKEN
ncbi:YNFM family putative membrane transporter [Neobacillus niacini]|uniref:MFS transporter n=1 Tax=Neobacillus driksii TaxID=3035913 RepID=UPI002782DD0F|nr:MFS transporter [Neobacillus niacini]MDQ0970403.1 YNFM family putative membrane transporter [Neobacillus niacini]